MIGPPLRRGTPFGTGLHHEGSAGYIIAADRTVEEAARPLPKAQRP